MSQSDLITVLQEQLDSISQQLYTSIGVVQRDAPAVPLDGESVISHPEAPKPDIEDLAKNIVSSIKKFNELVENLPSVGPLTSDWNEAEDLERLETLQRENDEAAVELAKVTKEGERWLAEVQEALRVIGSDHLDDPF